MTYKLICGCVKAHTSDAIVRRGEVKRGTLLRACVAHGGTGEPVSAGRRYAAGRRVRVPKQVVSARDLIRRHLREEGYDIKDLAKPWGVAPETVKSIMGCKRGLCVGHIESFCEFLKLDEFDKLEMHLQGAIELGWQLDALKKKLL